MIQLRLCQCCWGEWEWIAFRYKEGLLILRNIPLTQHHEIPFSVVERQNLGTPDVEAVGWCWHPCPCCWVSALIWALQKEIRFFEPLLSSTMNPFSPGHSISSLPSLCTFCTFLPLYLCSHYSLLQECPFLSTPLKSYCSLKVPAQIPSSLRGFPDFSNKKPPTCSQEWRKEKRIKKCLLNTWSISSTLHVT